jgi:hypothetical protein
MRTANGVVGGASICAQPPGCDRLLRYYFRHPAADAPRRWKWVPPGEQGMSRMLRALGACFCRGWSIH